MKIRFLFTCYYYLLALPAIQRTVNFPQESWRHITHVETGRRHPDELGCFALPVHAGTPYKCKGSEADPQQVWTVSVLWPMCNRFEILVPRTYLDFTPVQEINPTWEARQGDLILFTRRTVFCGWDCSQGTSGHYLPSLQVSRCGLPFHFGQEIRVW